MNKWMYLVISVIAAANFISVYRTGAILIGAAAPWPNVYLFGSAFAAIGSFALFIILLKSHKCSL
jgi:hypothetical protein